MELKIFCPTCEHDFVITYTEEWERILMSNRKHCDECAKIIDTEKEQEEKAKQQRQWEMELPELYEASGIPQMYRVHRETNEPLKPVNDELFKLFMKNTNLLVTGETGCGKSTSSCIAACSLIKEKKRVKYLDYKSLQILWKDAKTSQWKNEEDFFNNIQRHDYLIIDECAGKSKNTESSQEMMFELLERVNSGKLKTKLWLLGNFYSGSITELFGDDKPVHRRLKENFICTKVSENGKVKIF